MNFLSFERAISLWKQDLTKKSKEGSSYSKSLQVLFSNLKMDSMWPAKVWNAWQIVL